MRISAQIDEGVFTDNGGQSDVSYCDRLTPVLSLHTFQGLCTNSEQRSRPGDEDCYDSFAVCQLAGGRAIVGDVMHIRGGPMQDWKLGEADEGIPLPL